MSPKRSLAFVTGASGQDGWFLTRMLLDESTRVHAFVGSAERSADLGEHDDLAVEPLNLLTDSKRFFDLVAAERPDEIYNLAGQSSVARSFVNPIETWHTNATFVAELLDCVRQRSPETRLYQASSTEMFGGPAGGSVVHDESSALHPCSPYAAAKSAAHLLCRVHREQYGVRAACGILSNHESHRRRAPFFSRKVADHVRQLRTARSEGQPIPEPLRMGNLRIERDWGFAPDYVRGIIAITRQIPIRSELSGVAIEDHGANYRDYILGTGDAHAVWEIVDAAFAAIGEALDWDFSSASPLDWSARFRRDGTPAVIVDPTFIRHGEPFSIRIDPSRARNELGWSPSSGVEVFVRDMIDPSHSAEPATTARGPEAA